MPDLIYTIKADDQTGSGISKAKSDISDIDSAASSAQGALGDLGGAMDDLDSKAGSAGESTGGLSDKLGSLGTIAAAGAAAGVGVVAGVCADAIGKVSALADQTISLQHAIGGTPEAASQLIFAFGQMGVSGDQAQGMLDKLSKGLLGLQENADGTTTKSSAVVDTLKNMGIAATDASGQAVPMQTIMGQLADKFSQMPDGAEKTALAMQLFGKSGVDMIPFLDKGSAGLDDLYKKSDQLGLTLSGSTLDAVHETTAAHREFSAAVDGLEVQLGVALMPAVAAAAQGLAAFGIWMSTVGSPAIKEFAEWFSAHLQPAIKAVSDWVDGTFLPAWQKDFAEIQTATQAVVDFFSDHWSDIMTVAGPVLDTLKSYVETTFDIIKTVIQTVLNDIQDIITIFTSLLTGNWKGAWDGVKQLVSDTLDGILKIIQDEVSFFETALSSAWDIIQTVASGAWDKLKGGIEDTLKALLQELQNLPGQIVSAIGDLATTLYDKGVSLIKGLEQGIIDEAKNLPGQVGGAIQGAINSVPGVGGVLSKIPGLASGGIVSQPTLAVVGENGPEAVIPLGDISTIQPPDLSGLPAAAGGGLGGASAAAPWGARNWSMGGPDSLSQYNNPAYAGAFDPSMGYSSSINERAVTQHAQQEIAGTTPAAVASQKTADNTQQQVQNTGQLIAQGQQTLAAMQAMSGLGDYIKGTVAASYSGLSTTQGGVAIGSTGPANYVGGGLYGGYGGNSGVPIPGDPYGGGEGSARFAAGGVITEPVYGVGASGRRYVFGENGAETVTPGAGGGGNGSIIINVNVSALDASGMQSIMPELMYQLQNELRRAGLNGFS